MHQNVKGVLTVSYATLSVPKYTACCCSPKPRTSNPYPLNGGSNVISIKCDLQKMSGNGKESSGKGAIDNRRPRRRCEREPEVPNVGVDTTKEAAGGENESKTGVDSEECARRTTNIRGLNDVAGGTVSVTWAEEGKSESGGQVW